jgi:Domain of unknown function (DUF4160)
MPVVDRIDGFTFYFFTADVLNKERPHVHVAAGRQSDVDGKLWLDTFEWAKNGNLNSSQRNKARSIALREENHLAWLEKWKSYE